MHALSYLMELQSLEFDAAVEYRLGFRDGGVLNLGLKVTGNK